MAQCPDPIVVVDNKVPRLDNGQRHCVVSAIRAPGVGLPVPLRLAHAGSDAGIVAPHVWEGRGKGAVGHAARVPAIADLAGGRRSEAGGGQLAVHEPVALAGLVVALSREEKGGGGGRGKC